MTGAEKISEATQNLADIKDKIQQKYDTVMGKIEKLQTKMEEIYKNTVGHSQQWVDEKVQLIKGEIERMMNDVKAWMDKQLQKAQEWLDGIKKEIEDFLKELIASMINALAGL